MHYAKKEKINSQVIHSLDGSSWQAEQQLTLKMICADTNFYYFYYFYYSISARLGLFCVFLQYLLIASVFI